jgi:hypothetical protein
VNALTFVGLAAVTLMVMFYALEARSHWFVLAFAVACVLGSIYGFLQGAWPFGVVEAIWAMIAARRWTAQRRFTSVGLETLRRRLRRYHDEDPIERDCRARAERAGRDAEEAKGTPAEQIHRQREARLLLVADKIRCARLVVALDEVVNKPEPPDTDPPRSPAKAQRMTRNATWDEAEPEPPPDNVTSMRR